MRDTILDVLKNSDKALSVYEIEEMLGINDVNGLKEILKELNSMEDELIIYRTNKNNYMLFNNSHLKLGKMIGTRKGYGFVDIEGDEDVFVAASNMNGAIHDDKVVVEIISKKGLDLEGRIVKIVERKFKDMVGEFYFDNKNQGHVKLIEEKLHIDIVVDRDKSMGAMEGHQVLVKICQKLSGNSYKGEILKILGHKNDPGVDILTIVNKLGIHDTFPDEVMSEVANLPDSVSESEMEGRHDLRDMMIFTIDGDDTKDIDDAISLDILSNGNYKLGVHIADVSYYVRENTELDREAYERGTSVYLADRVIPMLPHKLSNGICSLNPNVDRLAVTCEMEVNNHGDVVKYDIYPSVIRSRKQMTYKCVNKILEEDIVPQGYEDFADNLKQMLELSKIIRENKVRRGCIDFDIDEAKIIVNDKGEAIDVVLRNRGVGEKLIEDFMIIANETVATCINYMDLPFIYRVHGEPSEEKINDFLKFISTLGYKINGDFKKVTPWDVQKILDSLRDKPEFPILSKLLLRSMQKAVYDSNNIGHFGIASKCYTHFTSPIRRYPDTTVHRLLHKYLFEHKLDNDTINYWDLKLPVLAAHTSECERNSIECEREVDDMKKAEFMLSHIGEEFDGVVSSIVSFGMFVELPNLVEGLIKIDDLVDDTYIFNEDIFSLIGTNTKKRYRLGDKIKVVVKAANKEARTVDFLPVKDKK